MTPHKTMLKWFLCCRIVSKNIQLVCLPKFVYYFLLHPTYFSVLFHFIITLHNMYKRLGIRRAEYIVRYDGVQLKRLMNWILSNKIFVLIANHFLSNINRTIWQYWNSMIFCKPKRCAYCGFESIHPIYK